MDIPRIAFDLGIKIDQRLFKYDRSENLIFALAVENCVNGEVTAAFRNVDTDRTTLMPITGPLSTQKEEALKNGSVLRVFLKGFFPFELGDAARH